MTNKVRFGGYIYLGSLSLTLSLSLSFSLSDVFDAFFQFLDFMVPLFPVEIE